MGTLMSHTYREELEDIMLENRGENQGQQAVVLTSGRNGPSRGLNYKMREKGLNN